VFVRKCLVLQSCNLIWCNSTEYGYGKKYKKVKPKVIIVKKIIPLSTTTFAGWWTHYWSDVTILHHPYRYAELIYQEQTTADYVTFTVGHCRCFTVCWRRQTHHGDRHRYAHKSRLVMSTTACHTVSCSDSSCLRNFYYCCLSKYHDNNQLSIEPVVTSGEYSIV